jgi:hypothetical protein
LIVELAIASSIPVSEWRNEDDATIVTALDIYRIQHDEIEKARRKNGR